MGVYYILMALIIGLAYPLCIRKPSDKKNIIYVSIIFGYMLLMSVFRYGIGNDFFNYRSVFYYFAENPDSLLDRFTNRNFEIGYTFIMQIAKLLGGDYLILNLLMAVLILLPTAFVTVKYSKMPWLSCWLYLTVTFFYNSLNFTRQSLAAATVLLSYGFIKEKKHWAVVLMILAGSLFHMSVLLVLPVYFLSLIKPSPKLYAAFGGVAAVLYIFSDRIIEFVITKFLPSYSVYLDSVFIKVGFSWGFLIVPFAITAFLFAAYYTGWRDESSEAGLLLNFSFFSSLIWLFITKHFIIERFTLPIYIFILLSIPDALMHYRNFRMNGSDKGAHFKNRSENPVKRFLKYALKNGKYLFGVLTAAVLTVTVTYNDFCISQGVHGVFPYKSIFNAASEFSDEEIQNEYRRVFPSRKLQEYFTMVRRGDFTTVIAVNGDPGSKLDLSSRMILRQLGFKTNLNKLEGKSYVGVVSGGKAIYEFISEDVIEEKLAICDNSVFITVVSGGSLAERQAGQVFVDNMNYTPNLKGLNVAIFDNSKKKIAASQTFDISTYDYTCTNTTAFYGEILIEE
ncbi:MAG: EpsG family protein [Oscillospiraceae bacterium]|nr:EpsG family protein [Oscillospiraceae bacterium]